MTVNKISFRGSGKNNMMIVLFFVLSFAACKTKEKAANTAGTTSTAPSKGITEKEQVLFTTLFFDANKSWILGDYDMAEANYSRALKIDPASAACMYGLARIYDFQNNKNQALFYAKKAATAEPGNTWYQLLYADCLRSTKQPEGVVSVYERLVKDNPNNFDFYYELAIAYLYVNKTSDALKTYNKIEEQIGVTAEASEQKLKIYKGMGNLDKAIEETKKLIRTFPKESKYYGILGELYQDKGQNEKALEAYNDLLKMDPSNAYVHLSLADYYRSQKQNDKAFQEIKIAFQSKDLGIDPKVKILLSYYDITENYPELKPDADELCRILVAVHPDEAKAFAMYGDFLFRDKKYEEARVQYRKSIALDKEKFAIWNQLMEIENQLNDFVSLEKESKEAMDLFPNQAASFFYNGVANFQLKKYNEALESLSEGKEFVYDNKPLLSYFYATIGDVQNRLKNNDASDEAYDKCLELDPSNVSVLNNYAYYLSLRNKDLEKAEEMSKKANTIAPNNSSYQDTYGWILYKMKKYDDAKTWVLKAIENGGATNGVLLEHYGDVLYQLGDIDAAVKYWAEAKRNGNSSPALDKKINERKLFE
ncbi:MAG: tetratricopeptide repeat protein [Bacteroidia bacterium]